MYRVLVVDDEAPLVESIARIDWAKQGCGLVGTAFNGEEALQKCETLMPHIIITDIAMPLMDGITLMERALAIRPEVQIILLTVHKNFDYALQAIQAGAVDYIVKDMHLHANLAVAMDKAIRRLALLSGEKTSGSPSILRLDTGMDARLHLPLVISHLAPRDGHVLLTLRPSPSLMDADALEACICSLHQDDLAENRFLQWGSLYYEMLVSGDPKAQMARLEARAVALLGTKAHLRMACSPLDNGAASYLAAHDANTAALDRMFYQPASTATSHQETQLPLLGKAEADKWLEALLALQGQMQAVETYIRQDIASHARAKQFTPHSLKQAFFRLLHHFEMQYAENAQMDARKAILDADSLDALLQALVDGIAAVLPGGNRYSYVVCEALDYLSEHYGKLDLQLSMVADNACISPGHLSRRLKEETGKSFQELLMQIRMESAAQLLRHTGDKVYTVAEKVGYQNYRTFINAFVHYYGVSPREFR